MKTLITLLLFSLTIQAQDTTYTIKTINKDRQITGYLIVSVLNNKVIKTERLCCYSEIERLKLRKNAKAYVKHSDIPKDFLKEDEYIKNGVLDNGK